MLRKTRTMLGLVFLLGMAWLFLDFTGIAHRWLGWMAKVQFVPAILALNVVAVVLLVVLTLLLGRVYCSVVCPLGVFQDVVAGLHSRRKKNRYRYSRPHTWLRTAFLVLFIAMLVLGSVSAAALIEPYSAFGRMAATLLQPLYMLANNGLAALAEHADSYAFYSVPVWVASVPTLIVAAVTLAVVVTLAWMGGRTYCNTVCPVGTLLGLLSRNAWFRPVIDTGKCNGCGRCERNCKATCIDSRNHRIDYSRCVDCMDCMDVCSQHAITFAHAAADKGKHVQSAPEENGQHNVADEGKRAFLLAAAVTSASALLAQEKKKTDGGLAVIEDKRVPERQTPLTPPGSHSARHFAQHCTACQLCVSKCPNQVLRPSSGLSSFMQPVMSYERGYCRPECNVCSEACPTGAIRPITLPEKSALQIGHAVWVQKNCVPLTDGVACGNCARHCPTGAITMVPSDPNDQNLLKVPAVNEARCIGCGACENLCPARPFPAIYVEGHEVHKEI
ncbi:MAG: 4Fe-4S dicluster domain-containing protein [Prevotella sp.]